jgi:initiation factor 1A
MPKKTKKPANKDKRIIHQSRALFLKSDIKDGGEVVYGQVNEILGSCNFKVLCYDSIERLCHIRKTVKKQKQKVEKDTIVIIGLRDFDDKKGDIIYVYTKEESKLLRDRKEIPSFVVSDDFYEDHEDIASEVFDFDTI